MNKIYMLLFAWLIIGAAVSGCASNRDIISKAAIAERNDIFTDVNDSSIHQGKAIADIKFPIKSNSSYFMGSYNKHTNPPYRVSLKISGQVATLEAEPVLEDMSPIDSTIPESGTGWRYQFSKRIALAPGKHLLTIALPIDDVIVEREIELRPGINTVTMTPVYKRKMLRPYKGENFTAGVKSVDVIVN